MYEFQLPAYVDTDGYSDRDREMFICGMEYQSIVEQMVEDDDIFDVWVHAENLSRLRMSAVVLDRLVNLIRSEGTWSLIRIT